MLQLTGNLIEDTKRALDANMSACAGVCSRLRGLQAIANSGAITTEVFFKLAGQDPSTLDRDLEWANQSFQSAKAAYEKFCANTGLQTYAVYNED